MMPVDIGAINALFAKGDGKGLIRRVPAPKGRREREACLCEPSSLERPSTPALPAVERTAQALHKFVERPPGNRPSTVTSDAADGAARRGRPNRALAIRR